MFSHKVSEVSIKHNIYLFGFIWFRQASLYLNILEVSSPIRSM